jgi:DNA primase
MVSIAEVLTLLDFVPAKSAGKQQRGPCPLHGSANPKSLSFSVNLGKHAFQCFTCKRAGNQLDLWAAAIRKPLFEAAVELCQRLNHDIPWKETRTEKRNP